MLNDFRKVTVLTITSETSSAHPFLNVLRSFAARVVPTLFALVVISTFSTLAMMRTQMEFYRYIKQQRLLAINNHLHSVDGVISSSSTLLVIFTTFDQRTEKPFKTIAHRIVISNWAHLIPTIQPVLFIKDLNYTLAVEARQAGWHVVKLTEFSEHDVPRLKPMYRHVFENYNSTFYGYSNGDILYDQSLLRTLRVIQRQNLTTDLNNNALVIGQRRNVAINPSDTSAYEINKIQDLGRSTDPFTPWAVDYFFFTRENCSLNWTALANVVIGRPAYDNYLVGISRLSGVHAIDASVTLVAIHLSAPDKLHGEGFANKDAGYNYGVIGPFNWNTGLTISAELVTRYDMVGREYLTRR